MNKFEWISPFKKLHIKIERKTIYMHVLESKVINAYRILTNKIQFKKGKDMNLQK